jgi:hypothetical protein
MAARVTELTRQLQTSQDYHQEELIALQQRHAQALSALHAQHEADLEVIIFQALVLPV